MRSRARQAAEPSPLEILDQAFHLLRLAPARVLAGFYLGGLPFCLGLLYFLSDMRWSAFARERAGEAAFGVTLLYLWMKTWQAVFARELRARLRGAPPPSLTPREWLRLGATQAALQPTGLFMLPLALFLVAPFAWVYAFYQNLTVTGDYGAARRHCLLWPIQNHWLTLFLAGFGFFVFLNVAAASALLPFLLKMLFGVESDFTRSPLSMINTTFLGLMLCLTYLLMSPLTKAVYTLRCFYADSRSTGEDLKTELNLARSASVGMLIAALCAGVLLAAAPASASPIMGRSAGEAIPRAQATHIPAEALEDSIRATLQRREFSWRLPRPAAPPEKRGEGLLGRFFDSMAETLKKWAKTVARWSNKFIDWLRRVLPELSPRAPREDGSSWLTSARPLAVALLIVAVAATALFVWRTRRRAGRVAPARSGPIQGLADPQAEESTADQVGAELWIAQARDLMLRGNLRHALRALYLGSLSLLAQRQLLTLARHKSNRDYEAELHRRGRTRPELARHFTDMVAIFERVWYGRHEATEASFEQCATSLDSMRSDAEQ
ncbi:MAG: DUF4129 domain-containing protein [Acidobacteriota bacterium]